MAVLSPLLNIVLLKKKDTELLLIKTLKALTTGVGQTGKYMNMGVDEAIAEHTNKARSFFPSFDSYPPDVQAELVQGVYRGDVGGSPKFRKLLNEGRFTEAASEFLNNAEYKDPKTSAGIKRRMKALSNSILSLNIPSYEPQSLENTLLSSQPSLFDRLRSLF